MGVQVNSLLEKESCFMNTFISWLKNQKDYYDCVVERANKSLVNAPSKGNVRIAGKRDGEEYYLCTESGDTNGRYIKKKDRDIVKAIIQRDYDRKILQCSTEWISWIDKTLRTMPQTALKDIYEISERRKKFITPYELSDVEYRRNWESVTYTGKPFKPDDPEIYTEKKERVRSKSEKMIADKLFFMNIPYRYEYPLEIDNARTFYPDFTVLNVSERKEYRLEHFGKMDDLGYVERTVRKINTYARNGYYAGENILYTYETLNMPIDMIGFERMIEKYFI